MGSAEYPSLALQEIEHTPYFTFQSFIVTKSNGGLYTKSAQNCKFVLILVKIDIIGHAAVSCQGCMTSKPISTSPSTIGIMHPSE